MRRGPQTFHDPQEALVYWARSYRKNLWLETPAYVEIWCESDSVAGTIYDVIHEYGLSLMTSRGFSSATYLHNAAAHLAEMDVPCWLYYLGDWDPSGKLIPEDIECKLNKFAKEDHHADVDIHFERLAITPELIETMNLPTKPAKTDSSHARGWQGGTVEIEALPVPVLRNMLERAILQHISASLASCAESRPTNAAIS